MTKGEIQTKRIEDGMFLKAIQRRCVLFKGDTKNSCSFGRRIKDGMFFLKEAPRWYVFFEGGAEIVCSFLRRARVHGNLM